jgi:mono/diheme cytochrome c family protein
MCARVGVKDHPVQKTRLARWLVPLLVGGLTLAGCQQDPGSGSGSGSGKGEGRNRSAADSEPSADLSVANAQRANAVYAETCATCHGGQRQGGVGPSLIGVGSRYSQAKIEQIAQFGKGRKKEVSMPAGLVSAADAQLLALWLQTDPRPKEPGPRRKLGATVSGLVGNTQ